MLNFIFSTISASLINQNSLVDCILYLAGSQIISSPSSSIYNKVKSPITIVVLSPPYKPLGSSVQYTPHRCDGPEYLTISPPRDTHSNVIFVLSATPVPMPCELNWGVWSVNVNVSTASFSSNWVLLNILRLFDDKLDLCCLSNVILYVDAVGSV